MRNRNNRKRREIDKKKKKKKGNSIKRGREIDRREIQIIKEKNGIYKKEQEQNQFIEKRIKIDNNRRGIKKEKKLIIVYMMA